MTSPTPTWMLRPEPGLCPCGCIGKRRKGGFVEKTLGGGAALLHQALFADEVASSGGLLQRLDPRVKLVSLFGVLVATAFVRHTAVLLVLYGATLVLAVASRISLSFFVKRVWLFVPIFTGIVVLPATLNLVTHGEIVVSLGTWFGHRVGFTRQGLTAAGLIVARVAMSISIVVLLTVTTSWTRLLAALRGLRIGRIVILVLGMAYRYLFHLLNAVTEMYTSRTARTVRRDTDVTSGRRFVAAAAGALFGKAQALSEEVHMAMISRGYTGDALTVSTFRVRLIDVGFALTCGVVTMSVLGADRFLGR